MALNIFSLYLCYEKIGMVLVSFEKRKVYVKKEYPLRLCTLAREMTQANIRWSSGNPVGDREEGL